MITSVLSYPGRVLVLYGMTYALLYVSHSYSLIRIR